MDGGTQRSVESDHCSNRNLNIKMTDNHTLYFTLGTADKHVLKCCEMDTALCIGRILKANQLFHLFPPNNKLNCIKNELPIAYSVVGLIY